MNADFLQAYHIITLSFSTIYSTPWKQTATSCQSYGRAMAKLYREAGHVVEAYLKILKKLNMGRLVEMFSGWALETRCGRCGISRLVFDLIKKDCMLC